MLGVLAMVVFFMLGGCRKTEPVHESL